MDGYAFSSCDLARLAAEASGLSLSEDAGLPSEERIRQNIIQVPVSPCAALCLLRVPPSLFYCACRAWSCALSQRCVGG